MFIRVVNALLGLWLFVSAFMFTRGLAPFWNMLVVSLLVILFALASILGRHGARRVNAVLGMWLFISALLLPQAHWGGTVNQIVCAVFVVITALFPHVHYQSPARAA
jgi:hypothetical protein